jgi:hypothetical protein
VILDDATSEIYYAQLVEEESTRTVMAGLREVIETKGLFCALYSDRGSHFFITTKAGENVERHRLTQVGRAMKELGVQMIPTYSPQARGRGERSFGTWQGRLPQELRLAGIETVEGANRFLREHYIAVFNQKFTVPAREKGTAFRRTTRSDLNWVFTVQTERVVAKDNTVAIADLSWQLEKTRFRSSLAGCTVTNPRGSGCDRLHPLRPACCRPLSRRPTAIGSGEIATGEPWKRRARGNGGKPKPGFPPPLGNPQKQGFPLFHRSDNEFYFESQNPQTSFGEPKRFDGLKKDKGDQIMCE